MVLLPYFVVMTRVKSYAHTAAVQLRPIKSSSALQRMTLMFWNVEGRATTDWPIWVGFIQEYSQDEGKEATCGKCTLCSTQPKPSPQGCEKQSRYLCMLFGQRPFSSLCHNIEVTTVCPTCSCSRYEPLTARQYKYVPYVIALSSDKNDEHCEAARLNITMEEFSFIFLVVLQTKVEHVTVGFYNHNSESLTWTTGCWCEALTPECSPILMPSEYSCPPTNTHISLFMQLHCFILINSFVSSVWFAGSGWVIGIKIASHIYTLIL